MAVLSEELARYRGSLFGLATGDAFGATYEFSDPLHSEPTPDLVGGGVFGLKPGQWTDDTSLALCLATSLVECKRFEPRDQLDRYLRWYRNGYMSSTGRCFDIGRTTRLSLDAFETKGMLERQDPPHSEAGNGSIMRLTPVPMAYAGDPEKAIERCAGSSRTTHSLQICVDACRYMGSMLVGALNGVSKAELLHDRYAIVPGYWDEHPLHIEVGEIARGSFKRREPPEINGAGYVIRTLEAALWALDRTSSFQEGLIRVVSLGGDTDTTGAVYGQIAGAIYGIDAIPEKWLTKLAMKEEISRLADALYELSRKGPT